MADKNAYGLSRNIPESLKRQIRQECGFGCVICGCPIIQYEHIDPEFRDATTHDPKRIGLLCGTCHQRKTSRMLSKARVLMARENPRTFKEGKTGREVLDLCEPFELVVGRSLFRDVRCVVRTQKGEEWFTIEPPEAPGAPSRISAKFYGSYGSPQLEIKRNEWCCSTKVWDLNVRGPHITVWNGSHDVVLRLKTKPPHGLEIRALRMLFMGTGLVVKPNGVIVLVVDGQNCQFDGISVEGADTVFAVP